MSSQETYCADDNIIYLEELRDGSYQLQTSQESSPRATDRIQQLEKKFLQ